MDVDPYAYFCRIFSWQDNWPVGAEIDAKTEWCIPKKYWNENPPGHAQIPLDELMERSQEMLEEIKTHGEYDNTLLYQIKGNEEGIMWQHESINSPTMKKTETGYEVTGTGYELIGEKNET